MIRSRALTRIGAAMAVAGLVSGCASFPAMTVTTTSAPDPSARAAANVRASQIGRPESQVMRVPRAPAAAQAAPVPEATPAQIAALIPEGPIGASLPAQPLPQFLNTVFTEVLKVPYSLGPNLGQRGDIITLNAPPNTPKRAYVVVLQNTLRNYGLTLSVRGNAFLVTEEGGTGGPPIQIIRSRSSADTPIGARNVVQYFQLVALQADSVKLLVQSMVGRGVVIDVDSAANALTVTGNGRAVAQAVDILRNLDQPAFAGAQVVRLEPVFWSADTFAQALQSTLAAEGYIVSSDPLGAKSILILPLSSTNQTLAFAADSATMDRVRYWARELDQPSALGDQNSTFVYEVRNTGASAIGQMLINAGASAAQQTGRGGGLAGAGQALQQALGGVVGAQQAGRAGANNNQNRGGGIQQQQLGGGQGQNNQAGRAGGANINTNQAGRTGAASTFANAFGGVVPGGGAITVDDAGNRILFTGTATQFSQLRTLLQQLDAPARQVRVEVTVAEVTLTDTTRAGLEWFFNAAARNGGVTSGGTQIVTPTGTTSGLSLGTSGLNINFNGGDLRAAFNAFASNDKVNVLSRPSLTARSGSPGSIQVGADVPYIQQQRAANTGTTALDVIQTVSYRQTGVILQVTPIVYGDDRVDLTIYQEVSDDRVNPNTAITSPIFDTRSISTTLSLADGETAVLGGLIEDSYSKGNAGIPFLKDLPVLGQAFRTDTVDGRKTELVVLITPFIIRDSEEMTSIANQMTTQINEAFRVGRGGSYTLTPWHTGQSLAINPPNPNITQDFARPTPSSIPAPAAPLAAQPATIPAAPAPVVPAPNQPAAPPPAAPAPATAATPDPRR